MAVTSVEEIQDGRGGSFGTADDQEVSRTFRVTCDDNDDNAVTIAEHCWGTGELPQPMIDSFPGASLFMLCKRLELRQEHGKKIWNATARYDTRAVSREDREKATEPNPILRDAVWSGVFERGEKLVPADVNDGDLIVNSAGEPFEEPAKVPQTMMRLHGRLHVAPNAIPSWFYGLKDKINQEEYVRFGQTFAEKTLVFLPGEITEPREENGVEYITIHWDIEYNEETWEEVRVDNGFNELNDAEDDLVPIEHDGDKVATPWPLSEGHALDVPSVQSGEHDLLRWDVIEEADFSVLP